MNQNGSTGVKQGMHEFPDTGVPGVAVPPLHAAVVLEALNDQNVSAAIIDRELHCLLLNVTMRQHVGRTVSVMGSRFALRLPGAGAFLKGAVGRTLDDTAAGHRYICLPREGKFPLVINLRKLRQSGLAEEQPLVLLTLSDLEDAIDLPELLLQQAFDLTTAEARLAKLLVVGRSPQEAAALLKISMPTIRSQLGSIFAKTRTSRQGELIATLTRLACVGRIEAAHLRADADASRMAGSASH
jgi:DNA-binding CsgD family transcriptional regulator